MACWAIERSESYSPLIAKLNTWQKCYEDPCRVQEQSLNRRITNRFCIIANERSRSRVELLRNAELLSALLTLQSARVLSACASLQFNSNSSTFSSYSRADSLHNPQTLDATQQRRLSQSNARHEFQQAHLDLSATVQLLQPQVRETLTC